MLDPQLWLESSIPPMVGLLLLPLVIWEAVWKGIALWHSARKGDKVWFISIMLLNTVGILPIVYLLLSKERAAKKTKKS